VQLGVVVVLSAILRVAHSGCGGAVRAGAVWEVPSAVLCLWRLASHVGFFARMQVHVLRQNTSYMRSDLVISLLCYQHENEIPISKHVRPTTTAVDSNAMSALRGFNWNILSKPSR